MVNLYSDTQTRPTPGMREAIAPAGGGDEERRDDLTTVALEERVAALLGHEAAVFLPSGTMCNEIAIRLHIRPGGDEILLGLDTHPLRFEGGAPAALSGAVMTVVDGDAGMFTPEALDATIRSHPAGDRYAPRRRSAPPRPAPATPPARGSYASSSRRTWAAAASGRSRRWKGSSTSRAS